MGNITPTSDQIVAQIRILLPVVGTLVSILGWWQADKVNAVVAVLLQAVGPVMYIGTAIWSLFANSRMSIMASAAKPVSPGVPAPQIQLPQEEAKLAAALPHNVTTQ